MNISISPIININNNKQNLAEISFCGVSSKEDSFFKSEQKGLTSFIRKHRLSPQDADRILEMNPEFSRYLGDIPHNWLQVAGIENAEDTDKRVKEALSAFAKATYNNSESYDIYADDCKELSESLTNILSVPVSVEYLDEGEAGTVFTVDVDNKKYALKTFHDYSKTGRKKIGHGAPYETLDAAFVSRNIPSCSNRYVNFYISKYAKDEDGDAFILCDYIDKSTMPAKQHKLSSLFEPVYSLDTIFANKINGKIFDFGGLRYRYPKYNHSKMRIIRILCDFVQRCDEKAFEKFEKKYGNTPDYKAAIEDFAKSISFLYGSKEVNEQRKEQDRLSEKQLNLLHKMT